MLIIIDIKPKNREMIWTLIFSIFYLCGLDLGDMTDGQGHDTTLGHGQQLCDILSKSSFIVESYDPDRDYDYVCSMTLILETRPWFKAMKHPWVMDNNCMK